MNYEGIVRHFFRACVLIIHNSQLERQIAGLIVCGSVKHLRVGCGSGLSGGLRSGSSRCGCGCCYRLSRRLVALLHTPSADTGVPATVELARLNVERNGYQVVNVAKVVLDTLLAEDFKADLARVLLLSLQYIRLYFPWVTRFANTFLYRKNLYDFSYYIHFVSVNS